MEKRPEKIILRWQHHLHLDVTIRKPNSTCLHAEEVADVVLVTLITMKKPNPLYLLAIDKKEEEIDPQ
jgi:uncharacterized protein (UPF0548 family)